MRKIKHPSQSQQFEQGEGIIIRPNFTKAIEDLERRLLEDTRHLEQDGGSKGDSFGKWLEWDALDRDNDND